jgi:radical SAM superfamily enzyme YgiQ (UPF0313 family)
MSNQSNKIKIVLADLAHTFSVHTTALTVPLNVAYIKAYLVTHHPDIEVELFKDAERLLKYVHSTRPSIVGFSHYGWNENLNRSVGNHIRSYIPEILIVAGGPNLDPDIAIRREYMQRHNYVDYFIVDNAEAPFSEFLHWWKNDKRHKSTLPNNLSWIENGAIFNTETQFSKKKNIDDIPSPYLGGHLDQFLQLGMIPMLETNRGCPFQCTFCAWGEASKNTVRRFNIETTFAEIEYIAKKTKAENWIICDANFGMLSRDVEIAKTIRRFKDTTGYPKKCHIWLAKNATQRNLEIGSILDEMIYPVMALQSLDAEVLKNIKRDNISIDTYVEYHKKFQKMGTETFSELIVPLPGETFASHVTSLRSLMELGTEIIFTHNLRMLSGAEINSKTTRLKYAFRTRYRLIHGDSGIYHSPFGPPVKAFEYEESLRETTSMSEQDLFLLRKLHFLIEVAWNIRVYKPLLWLAGASNISPIDVFLHLLSIQQKPRVNQSLAECRVKLFFDNFDESSQAEWFDTEEEIGTFFSEHNQFERLINQEFEKLNVQYSVILLQDYKDDFNNVIYEYLANSGLIRRDLLDCVAQFNFAWFPKTGHVLGRSVISLPANISALNDSNIDSIRLSRSRLSIQLVNHENREELLELIGNNKDATLSKILNARSFGALSLRELQLTIGKNDLPDRLFGVLL